MEKYFKPKTKFMTSQNEFSGQMIVQNFRIIQTLLKYSHFIPVKKYIAKKI